MSLDYLLMMYNFIDKMLLQLLKELKKNLILNTKNLKRMNESMGSLLYLFEYQNVMKENGVLIKLKMAFYK